MNMDLILTVALAAAMIVVVLALVGVIVFQRWRISDQNVHLKKFINENIELHEEVEREKITRRSR